MNLLPKHNLASFLDRKFRKNQRVILANLIDSIKHGRVIPAGTLVLMASGDRKLRLKILETNTPHKGFSEPMPLNDYAHEHWVTPNYLLWYLSHEQIGEYLLAQTTGTVFLRVPRKILHSLPIALPTRAVKSRSVGEVVIARRDDPFSKLIDEFYKDFRLNFTSERFRTAIILAGAICEVILYQLLIDQGVSPKMLSKDQGLALGKMLDYVRLLKLDQAADFPMNHLIDLQQKRNSAVHAGVSINNQRLFLAEDLAPFDHVIRYFGI
jgi:hypothetical protein